MGQCYNIKSNQSINMSASHVDSEAFAPVLNKIGATMHSTFQLSIRGQVVKGVGHLDDV